MTAMDPRLASLALVIAVGGFVVAARPRRRAAADDTLSMLGAVELRVEEPERARVVRLPVPITIGRSPTATVVVSDARVSRVHARIDEWNGQLAVRDLESRNGTWVNARPVVEPLPLTVGDEIEVGATRIVFCGVGPLASAAERNSRRRAVNFRPHTVDEAGRWT